MSSTQLKLLIAIILAALAGGGFTLAVEGGDDGPQIVIKPAKPKIVTAAPTGPTGPTGPAGELDSTEAEIQELRDPIPDDVPKAVIEKAEDKNDALQEDLPAKPLPVGGAQGYSVRKSITTIGFGAYRSKVNEFCLHYTVSHNLPGWTDIYSVEDYLKRVGLNATFIADFEGHILQAGPVARNPYTQGWFNQYCESIEIIAYGDETKQQWLDSPLIKKGILAALVRDRLKARGLPLRRVDPVGCNAPLGWTDHNALECGNDHHDVSPNFPYATFQKQLDDGPRVAITKRDRDTCAKVRRYRERVREGRKEPLKAANRTRQAKRLKFVHGRDHHCLKGKAKQK